jgi:hypothetical protein
MRFGRTISVVLIAVSAILPLSGQLISVTSGLSSDSMMIGDQVVFSLQVDAADHVDFMIPEIRDTLSRDIEVLFPITADTSLADGRRVVEQRFMITGFEPGFQLVPSQKVLYKAGEVIDTARSMPLMIRVIEPLVDTTQQIKPIKPPINTPLTFREMLPWIALGIGGWFLMTFIYALVWMQRQKQKDPEIFTIRPQEPAHVIAFRELDRLKQEKLWERGEVKQFYTRLTDITRSYIEKQYGIPAMERTTEEILKAFRRVNTENGILDEMLSGLLELADLVKFAKEDPLPVDNQTHLNNAYLFVQKTFPLFYREELSDLKEDSSDRKENLSARKEDSSDLKGELSDLKEEKDG